MPQGLMVSRHQPFLGARLLVAESRQPTPRRSPNAREAFNAEAIYDLIVWNAPDHEHTRYQLRGVLEELIGEQFDMYATFGGDEYDRDLKELTGG